MPKAKPKPLRYQEEKLDLPSFETPEPARVSAGLRKPVETLAMVPEEGGRISYIERKLYYTLIFFAQQQGWKEGQEVFRAPLSAVLKKMNYTSRNLAVIREALTAMVTTSVEWQSPTPTEGTSWGVSGMISHAEISGGHAGSTLEWSYSPKIRGSILDPHPYARGSLEVHSVLRSYASLALYDICSRYFTSSTGLTPRRPWQWWRPVLTGGSDGLDVDPQFKTFNRDVLKKAIFDVNKNTGIDVRLVTHKVGHKVVDIQFHSTRKLDYQAPLQDVKTVTGLKEIGRAIAAGVSQAQAELFLQKHGEESLASGLDVLRDRQEKTSLLPIKAPKEYLRAVLANQPFDATTGALVDVRKEAALERQQRLTALEQYRANKLEHAWNLFSESPEQDRADLTERFEQTVINVAPASTQKLYKRTGLQSDAIRSQIRHFLAGNFFGQSWNMPTDDELFKFVLIHPPRT